MRASVGRQRNPVHPALERVRKVAVLLLLVVIAAKTAAVVARGPVPLERDAFGYWHLSTLVSEGDWLLFSEPIAYRTPVYPWFLAAMRAFFGPNSLWMISVAQGFFAVGSVVIAGLIAARVSRLPLAMVYTLVASLPAIAALTFCSAVLSETLFVFLLMLNLLAVLDYCERGSGGRAAWVGITFALALLTRPIVLMLWIPHLAFVASIGLWRRRHQRATGGTPIGLGRRLIHLGVAGATAGILCAPWLFRNDRLFGEPFLTEFLGRNVWIVTFQDGSGAGLSLPESDSGQQLQRRLQRVGAEDQWQATWEVSNALVRSGLSDADADRLMKRVALDAIQSDTSRFLYKAFRRTINFWRCAATDLPTQGAESGDYYGQLTWKRNLPMIEWAIEHRWSRSVFGNTLLLILMIASLLILLISPSTRPYGIWFSLILAYFCIVTGILEIPAYRYRMVVEPIVAMVIGSAFAVLLSWRRLEAKLAGSS